MVRRNLQKEVSCCNSMIKCFCAVFGVLFLMWFDNEMTELFGILYLNRFIIILIHIYLFNVLYALLRDFQFLENNRIYLTEEEMMFYRIPYFTYSFSLYEPQQMNSISKLNRLESSEEMKGKVNCFEYLMDVTEHDIRPKLRKPLLDRSSAPTMRRMMIKEKTVQQIGSRIEKKNEQLSTSYFLTSNYPLDEREEKLELYDQQRLNIRQWLSKTIFHPLIRNVDLMNQRLSEMNHPIRIGEDDVSKLKQFLNDLKSQGISAINPTGNSTTAQIDCHSWTMTTLSIIINYFDLSTCQKYLLDRYRALSSGSSLIQFSFDSNENDHYLPSDSSIIMHSFLTYMDCLSNKTQHYHSNSPFSEHYFLKLKGKKNNSQQTRNEGKQKKFQMSSSFCSGGCNYRSSYDKKNQSIDTNVNSTKEINSKSGKSATLKIMELSSSNYTIQLNGNNMMTVLNDKNNVFDTIITFIWMVHTHLDDKILNTLSLNSDGVNLLCVLTMERNDLF
ncbi:hypothetical protein SNEBB_009053 [Seison nebaliae]|nr:hypothetical protein SNEBB_009053 [Seison nebaliae]